MTTNKLRVMIDREAPDPYTHRNRKPRVNEIIRTILIFIVALFLVIAAVAGALLAAEGPYPTDPIQRIHGGGK